MPAASDSGKRMHLQLERIAGARTSVAALVYRPRRPRGVWLVAGHGYSSSKHNLDFLCNFLASHGFGVASLDFPGHKLGASGGELRGFDDVLDAMHAVVEHVRDRYGETIYTMGHSMGAMTAIFTAGSDSGLAGTIAIATGLGRPSGIAALQKKGVTDFRSAYVDGVTLPELVAHVEEPFCAAIDRLAGRPQLYVAADRDAMVSLKSVEALFDRAHDPRTFVTIQSDHTYAAENARREVLAWLNVLHPRD